MTRALRRTWNRFLGSLSTVESTKAILPRNSNAISNCSPRNHLVAVFPPEEATEASEASVWRVESTKESYRDQRGVPFLDTLIQDLRYAFRGIGEIPDSLRWLILSLAIGIGANTAIFSLVNTVLLQPLAYKEPQRLFAARELIPHFSANNPVACQPGACSRMGKAMPVLEQVALCAAIVSTRYGRGSRFIPSGVDVPHNLFALLGVATNPRPLICF